MEDELSRGWQRERQYTGCFAGYEVQGDRYRGNGGETGWYITSFPIGDPIHNFLILGTAFHIVRAYAPGERSNRQVFDILGLASVEVAEKKAILEAIEAWEKRYRTESAQE
jgi:hypothetical protein